MKKVSLIFAMVLAVSFAMAQKTTWVTQAGTNNLADVMQTSFDGDATSIYATQSGDWNTLNTEQRGFNNYLELMQSGDHNLANMKQFTKGSPNMNTAVITQDGDLNKANLTQKEDPLDFPDDSKNKATATQSGDYNSYVLNQGGNEWSPTNEQYLTQSGDANNALIDQFGYTDYSEIRQLGNWNTTKLDQTAGQGGAGTATSNSWQQGTNNLLNILQDYDPSQQIANSIQNGVSNTTNIGQEGNGLQKVVSQQLGSDIIKVTQIGF